ncbi:hypothetical protein [Methanolobus sp. ZRKC5]|uniref:hypothetical protein n=1 Tax=unclassified Methanolobus TaxID=2629569 RepID=UPI00313B647E
MTGPLKGSHPATGLCRKVKCKHLLPEDIDTVRGPRISWYCGLTDKIPGNMVECPLDAPEEVMKVLAVRQPWASLIAMGIKVLDIRSTNCYYRGPVAIYATRGNVRRKDRKYFEEVLGRKISTLPHGKILCVVDISGTIPFKNPEKFAAYSECHYLSPFFFEKDMRVYGWIFQNVRPVKPVVGFKMPKGCINWSKIRANVIESYLPIVQEVTA